MPAGLQIWDENGVLLVDTSTRIGTVLGGLQINADGSLYDAVFLKGSPWWLFVPQNYSVVQTPVINYDGNGTLGWSSGGASFNGTLTYGIY